MYAFYQKHEYLIISLLLAFSFVFPILPWDGLYRDTDNFIHAWRVYDLMTQHHWGELLLEKSNYPFGEVIHYTRLMDVIWLILTLPFLPFLPLKQAVFDAGLVFQPFCMVITACAMIWAMRPYVKPVLRLLAVFYFFAQDIIAQLCVFGRPDHHMLVAFFSFLILGNLWRCLNEDDIVCSKAAGFFSGILLWNSVEGLLISYSLLAPLLLLWIWDGRYFETCKRFALYYFITAAACFIINPPYEGYFHADNGRLSISTVAIVGLTYLSLVCTDYINRNHPLKTRLNKAAVLGATALTSIGLILLVFGKVAVFGNPFVPAIKAWYSSVAELRPAIQNAVLFRMFALNATISVILLIGWFHPKNKEFLLLTGIPLLFTTGLTYSAIRFSQHSSVFLIFPVIYVIDALYEHYGASFFANKPLWAGVAVVVILGAGGVYIERLQCDTLINIQSGIQYDSKPFLPYLSPKEGAVLARVFDGSEIIWTTERPVISTPNHRNIDGIVDTYDIFFGNDMAEVVRLLKKRHITTILMPQPVERLDYLVPPRPDDFAIRLLNGNGIPCGVRLAKNVPEHILRNSLVYHVDFEGCPDID